MDRRQFLHGALGSAVMVRSTKMAARTGQTSSPAPPGGLARVQVLAFDVFGTVVDWRASVIAEGRRVGRSKGLMVDWAAFADAWRQGYAPSMNRVRTGELPWTRLDTLHRMTLDDLLVRFKIEGWHETEKADFNRVWHRLRPWPDSVDGLRRLRRRFVIAPLSNGNLSLLTNMAKHADLPWDCILSTELVKHYKPDPETYLMVPELFDLQPADVMMVAAHEADLEAARKLGLRTAYVHRPLEYGPDRATKPPTVGRFDVAATDFRDLATQLGATKN